MYLSHFGMREQPFSITPDTSYFFAYGRFLEAFNVLTIALRSGEGFIKVTGEVGTGKTILCRKLLTSLAKNFEVAYIPNPCLGPRALLLALADELGINIDKGTGQHQLLKKINLRLMELSRMGKNTVLCLDEAQTIPFDTLEYLRLLTNLETEKKKLLQIVLFGQPELNEHLQEPLLRQLNQRITFSYHLAPIDWKSFNAYIAYRLCVSGYKGQLFMPNAIVELYKKSRGIPRIANILSHKALMAAYGQGQYIIERQHVKLAVKDTESIRYGWSFAPRRLGFSVFLMIFVITMIMGFVISGDSLLLIASNVQTITG